MTVFDAKSIAIVGASREGNKVGHKILKNLISSYSGSIYPINPNASEILGIACYPNVKDIPNSVDMAVIAVPSKIVPSVLEDCGVKNVKTAVIISSGFKETGIEGAKLEKQCINIAKKYNMQIVGPNCFGVIDTDSGINTTFASQSPLKGNIGFMSQSGALCAAILDWASTEKVGFSKFISLGNKADLSENDFLQILYDDPNTKVILIYIEGLKDGQGFIKLTRRITKEKPVVVLKAGRTESGARAVASHTGTLAGSDNAYDAIFKQSGIIRVDSSEELFDYAMAFSYQPLPKGNRVAIITNAGGPGIIATDACEKKGLRLASFKRKTIDSLKENLPSAANIYNPVDVLGDATHERFASTLESLMNDSNVDSVLVLLTPQAMTDPIAVANTIAEISSKYKKPVLCSFMGGSAVVPGIDVLKENNIPNYSYPERAASSLMSMVIQKRITEQEYPNPKIFDVDKETVKKIFSSARSENRVNLGLEALDVLKAYGIPISKSIIVSNPKDAAKAADEIGYPVALKVVSPDILHKSDIGAVITNVKRDNIIKSYNQIINKTLKFMPKARILGVLVQEMVPDGVEIILGSTKDPQIGHLVMFGLGGIYVEILKDVSFGLAPLNEKIAESMISNIKAYSLLKGVRGEKPYDIDSISDSLLRVSQLVTDFPEIVEIDINPLKVFEKGKRCKAIDVRMILEVKK